MFLWTDRAGVLTINTTKTFVTNFGDLMGGSQMFSQHTVSWKYCFASNTHPGVVGIWMGSNYSTILFKVWIGQIACDITIIICQFLSALSACNQYLVQPVTQWVGLCRVKLPGVCYSADHQSCCRLAWNHNTPVAWWWVSSCNHVEVLRYWSSKRSPDSFWRQTTPKSNDPFPRMQKLWFLVRCQRDHKITLADPLPTSFMVRTWMVSDRLWSSNFRSWLMKTHLASAFEVAHLS